MGPVALAIKLQKSENVPNTSELMPLWTLGGPISMGGERETIERHLVTRL